MGDPSGAVPSPAVTGDGSRGAPRAASADPGDEPIDLDAAHVVATAARLCRRIDERFPHANLRRTARRVLALARETASIADRLGRSNLWLSLLTWLLVAAIPAAIVWASLELRVVVEANWRLREVVEFFQNAVGSLVFLAAGIAFLVTWQSRLERKRTLAATHELRVVAHLVDMHTLDKDPIYVRQGGPTTASSPPRGMSAFELNRYLDYCSELLSLLGKIGALYGKQLDDPVALAAIDGIEQLTTGLSRKIWQKVMLLERGGGVDA